MEKSNTDSKLEGVILSKKWRSSQQQSQSLINRVAFKPLVVVLSLATLSFGIVAAGSSTAGAGGVWKVPTINPIPAAVKLLPEAIVKSGVITEAEESDYPPGGYFESGTHTLTGSDAAIGILLAEALGLKAKVSSPLFPAIIPGIQAGRYDIAVDPMTPTSAREQVIDMVTYEQGGITIAVPKGNPKGLNENNLCGETVGTETGSYEDSTILPPLQAACTAAGKPAITVDLFPGQPQMVLALTSGRIDAICFDQFPMDWAAKQNSEIQIAQTFGFGYGAIGVSKQSGLSFAVYTAMAKIVKTPQYKAILAHWGLWPSAGIGIPSLNYN
jgi:polar amino acid transport system substrate-binding protein